MKSHNQSQLEAWTKPFHFLNDNAKYNKTLIAIQLKVIKDSHQYLIAKYTSNKSGYFNKKINELIYNQDSLYACLFKEFLIFEDENEFLKKYYQGKTGIAKLRNITVFYEKYSKMFPNYIKLAESAILYRNIQKKQKMIDKLQEMKKEEEKRKNSKENKNQCAIFHTSVNDSIINESNSFALNAKNMFNYKEDDDNSNDTSLALIEKIIVAIDEGDKAAENLSSRRDIVFLNSKNKMARAEMSKIHQSPSPCQKKPLIKPNQVQSVSSSANTTSILSTNNNSNITKDKVKAFEYKINQHLNGIFKINRATLTKLKKSSLIPSIASTPRGKYQSVYSPNHNPNVTQKSLIHSQSQSSYIMQNQFQKKIERRVNSNARANSNNSLSNNRNNFSKIVAQSKQSKSKLQSKYFEVDYFTQRGGKISGIDLIKVNGDLNQYDSLPSFGGLLSESQRQKYFKRSFISNNLSPSIMTKTNSPTLSNRKQKSVIKMQRIFEESKITNQMLNGIKRLSRRKMLY